MTESALDNLFASIRYTQLIYGVPPEAQIFMRHRAPRVAIEPTQAEWDLYNKTVEAVAALLEDYPGWADYEIEPPETRYKEGDYTETEADWIARCKALLAENGVPEKLDYALSVKEFEKLGLPTDGHRDAQPRPRYMRGGVVHPWIDVAQDA